MTKIITRAGMTDEQIESVVNELRDVMLKHRFEFTPGVTQKILRNKDLGMVIFTPFRERAEEASNQIIRTVNVVNLGRSQQEAIKATKREQQTDSKIVDVMPKGEGGVAEIVLFKHNLSKRKGPISNDDLDKEFRSRGFLPADPYGVITLNECDPELADRHPHSTFWRGVDGKWYHITFIRNYGFREVYVGLADGCFRNIKRLAGIRK